MIFDLWKTQSPARTLRYEIGDESFTVHTGQGSQTYRWDGIHALVQGAAIWHVEVSKGATVFFPVEACPPELRAFIRQACTKGRAA